MESNSDSALPSRAVSCQPLLRGGAPGPLLQQVLASVEAPAPRHCHHPDPDAPPAQFPPKLVVIGSPGREPLEGSLFRVAVDEGRLVRPAGDGHPGVEEPADPTGRSTVEAVGQQSGVDAQLPTVADFFRLGGKPGEGGMLQDVVERQQPAQEQGLADGSSVVQAGGADGLVERAAADPDQSGFGVDGGDGFLDGHPGRDQAAHEADCGHGTGVPPGRVLGADEQAAVQADQGDPFGIFASPAERLEVRDHGRVRGYGWLVA